MKIFSLAFAFLLGLGLQSLTANSNGQTAPDEKKSAFTTLDEDPNDDELRKLLKRRYNLALDFAETAEMRELVDEGRDSIMLSRTSEASEALLEATLELFDDPKLHERALVEHIERLKTIEEGISIREESREAEYIVSLRRLKAEIRLLKLQRQMQPCWTNQPCRTTQTRRTK